MTNETPFLVVVPYLDLAEETAHAATLVVMAPDYWGAIDGMKPVLKDAAFLNDFLSMGSDESEVLQANLDTFEAIELREIPDSQRVITVDKLRNYKKGML